MGRTIILLLELVSKFRRVRILDDLVALGFQEESYESHKDGSNIGARSTSGGYR